MDASPLIDSTEKELCVMPDRESHDPHHHSASLSHDHHHRISSSNLSGSVEEQDGTTAGLGKCEQSLHFFHFQRIHQP